jgi:putative transposase
MRSLRLQGVVRGRKCRRTIADKDAGRPLDLVKRQFQASRPNQLWMADFTYVATWAASFYVAFVIDVLARRIIGWRVACSMHAELVLDALEQALWSRSGTQAVVHHSDRSARRTTMRWRKRLLESTRRSDPPPRCLATSGGAGIRDLRIGRPVHHRRLLGPIGNMPPAELDASYYQSTSQLADGSNPEVSGKPGALQSQSQSPLESQAGNLSTKPGQLQPVAGSNMATPSLDRADGSVGCAKRIFLRTGGRSDYAAP